MTALRSVQTPAEAGRRELLEALHAFARGDFSVRMRADAGVDGELAEAFNCAASTHQAMAAELARLRDEVRGRCKPAHPVNPPAASSAWRECVEAINRLIDGRVRAAQESGTALAADRSALAQADARGDAAGGFGGLWRRAADRLNRLAAHPEKLQNRTERLQRTNRKLAENARQLAEQMRQVEYKNREVELARAALQRKAEQLALSSRYKTEFLANMSHELRTPLNSLLILAQMLAENPGSNLTPKQIEYTQTIHAAGKDLLALINDVLDLAKVESGTVTLEMGTEQFAELRDFLDRAFRQVGHDKGLKFGISLARSLPDGMRTDTKRLRQILKNLLSNAFKFTPRGSVSLTISPAASGWTPGLPSLDAADRVVSFAVADTGIGVAAHMHEIIFEAFQQGDGTTSRQFGGTGLGLSISAGLARLLGGEIKVHSSPGKGSTFTLYLPLLDEAHEASMAGSGAIAAPASARSRELTRPGIPDVLPEAEDPAGIAPPANVVAPGLAATKVLLVDDDIRNIFALTAVLEDQGMVVVNAENGLDGIETLRTDPDIDIVLMDMMMPELDGYDTIRIMRRLENVGHVPIIGISARAMKGDREKCIEAGASDYISKPVDVERLLAVMRTWLPAP